MIYFDNAATTSPKPSRVVRAVAESFGRFCANPGIGGHEMAMAASGEIYAARKAAAELFGASAENIAFTPSCTYALNFVIKGLLKPGDHVVISSLEHNAVYRPVCALEKKGVTCSVAGVHPTDTDITLDQFRKALTKNTRLIVCTHASNVWGIRLPIGRISALAGLYGIPILVDAAQAAGVLPIDVSADNISYLAVSAHKGLYAPMGTGMLITAKGDTLDTIIEGGTGSRSIDPEQPEFMPDRFESGTLNTHGIIGLKAGIEFVRSYGTEKIHAHEVSLAAYLYDSLKQLPRINLYAPRPTTETSMGVVSFNKEGMSSEELASALSRAGIAVRGGLHCAPLAHRYFGTIETGAVRASFSVSNTKQQIDALVSILSR